MTTIINGKEIKETLLEKQLESINRNNELLNENNVKLSEQNDKMLKYTKAIYIDGFNVFCGNYSTHNVICKIGNKHCNKVEIDIYFL